MNRGDREGGNACTHAEDKPTMLHAAGRHACALYTIKSTSMEPALLVSISHDRATGRARACMPFSQCSQDGAMMGALYISIVFQHCTGKGHHDPYHLQQQREWMNSVHIQACKASNFNCICTAQTHQHSTPSVFVTVIF